MTARLTLQDRFSSRLSRATREIKKAEKRSEELKKTLTNIGDRARTSSTSVRGLANSFVGLGVAIGGALAAKKLFDKTIGSAAQYEHSEILINAMFNDDKKAQRFMSEMTKLAEDSPVLNSQDMFSNAKSFISTSKDLDQLKEMYRLTEKMNVLDPMQGVDGAVLALKEFFSGDIVSLVERFEMPRSELKELKNLSLNEQINGLKKLLDGMGITDETVRKIGNSTLALWNQIQEKLDRIFRVMGQPALAKIRDFLDQTNRRMESGDTSGFIKYGQNILSALADGFIQGSHLLSNTLNGIINDPEFIKAEGVIGKGKFVLEKFYKGLDMWLENGGKKKIEKVITAALTTIIDAIGNNTEPIITAAAGLGRDIGGAIGKGISDAISNNPLAKAVLGAAVGGSAGSVIPGVGTVAGGVVGGSGALIDHYSGKLTDLITPWNDKKLMEDLESGKYKGTIRSLFDGGSTYKGNVGGVPKSHSAGLSFVPKSPYPATLHRGERVLTAEENRQYSQSRDGFSINITTMNVRKESDIDAIAISLARKLNEAGGRTV